MPIDKTLFWNAPTASRHVILVRNPRNLFASRIRKGFRISHVAYPREMNQIMLRTIQPCKEHVRLCLAYLEPKSSPGAAGDTVGIVFDHWLVNTGYRSAIASRLRITPSDKALDQQESQVLAEVLHDREIVQLRDEMHAAFSANQPTTGGPPPARHWRSGSGSLVHGSPHILAASLLP